MIIETNSEEETIKVAYDIASKIKPGTVMCLDGDLGTGKTVWAKGLAEGLGIKEPVVSPTFTILHTYNDGRMPMYHFDVYRITDIDEMAEIGYEDCFYGDGVSLVEWASIISDIIPKEAVKVKIEKDTTKGYDYRRITVEGLD